MGWGIRGQYGHQTGAMIAGVLVGLVYVLHVIPRRSSLVGARAVALLTLGISVGGSMTYGQTLGLTQDAALIGNWHALSWGLLGVFLKGGVWIGLGGLLLGIALGPIRYPPAELALMLMFAIFARFAGLALLNEPFDPASQELPWIYFSADWYWQPHVELKPRRELWGGLWLALVSLSIYVRVVRQDRLAFRLACWATMAGGVGFALGQGIQAFHAWNQTWFQTGPLATIEPFMNWWNMMEISFGATWAGILAVGVWLHQDWIKGKEDAPDCELTFRQELSLLLTHLAAILVWSFYSFSPLDNFAVIGFTMILLPVVATSMGRYWPFWVSLPIVLLPIAGKTLKQVTLQSELIPGYLSWPLVAALPVVGALLLSAYLAKHACEHSAAHFAKCTLLFTTWVYFAMNFAFFEFPWPWQAWTVRTPSAIIFAFCAAGLSLGCGLVGASARHR